MPVFGYIAGFIRTVFIIVLIYAFIWVFRRYIWPWVLQLLGRYVNRKMTDFARKQGFDPERGRVVKDDGEVKISYTDRKRTKPADLDGVGDYVEYEEID